MIIWQYLKSIETLYLKIEEGNSEWKVKSWVKYWKVKLQIEGIYKKVFCFLAMF